MGVGSGSCRRRRMSAREERPGLLLSHPHHQPTAANNVWLAGRLKHAMRSSVKVSLSQRVFDPEAHQGLLVVDEPVNAFPGLAELGAQGVEEGGDAVRTPGEQVRARSRRDCCDRRSPQAGLRVLPRRLGC